MKSFAKKLTVTAAGAAVLALSLAACSSPSTPDPEPTSTSSLPDVPVNMAVYNNAPPVEYIDEDGKLTGWMVVLLDKLVEELGIQVNVIQVSDFSTIIPGIQSGRFDAAAATITVTAERAEVLDMVTVNSVGSGFLTTKGGATIETNLDVCGLKVAALAGSVYATQMDDMNAKCADAGKSPATVSLYPDTSATQLAVQSGRDQAYLGSYGSLAYQAAQSEGKLVVQPYQFGKLPGSLAFPKNSPYTVPFQEAMNTLIENGEYQKILDEFDAGDIAIKTSEINPVVP